MILDILLQSTQLTVETPTQLFTETPPMYVHNNRSSFSSVFYSQHMIMMTKFQM